MSEIKHREIVEMETHYPDEMREYHHATPGKRERPSSTDVVVSNKTPDTALVLRPYTEVENSAKRILMSHQIQNRLTLAIRLAELGKNDRAMETLNSLTNSLKRIVCDHLIAKL